MLPKHFPCARFIISIRNPYATVEGIRRRVLQNQNTKLNLDTCTKHWIKTAELQQRNIGILPQSIWFTYEDMCEMTTDIEKQIQSLIPELGIFRFSNLQSLNKQSISNLTMEEIHSINRHLEQHEAMMHFFNYELIT